MLTNVWILHVRTKQHVQILMGATRVVVLRHGLGKSATKVWMYIATSSQQRLNPRRNQERPRDPSWTVLHCKNCRLKQPKGMVTSVAFYKNATEVTFLFWLFQPDNVYSVFSYSFLFWFKIWIKWKIKFLCLFKTWGLLIDAFTPLGKLFEPFPVNMEVVYDSQTT